MKEGMKTLKKLREKHGYGTQAHWVKSGHLHEQGIVDTIAQPYVVKLASMAPTAQS
jgi:hypothetical protein